MAKAAAFLLNPPERGSQNISLMIDMPTQKHNKTDTFVWDAEPIRHYGEAFIVIFC
jgi:hypothetical protein